MNNWLTKRETASIPIASNNLIICCGEETEVNYFNGAIKYIKGETKLENDLVSFIVDVDAVDPFNMAKNAEEKVKKIERDQNLIVDYVWILFDKDDFPDENFNNAINKINSLSNSNKKYFALWSNSCFELWLLLNFMYLQSDIARSEYFDKLSECLNEKYKKNDSEIFGKILLKKGNLKQAIINANRLLDNNLSPSKNVPATTVSKFFEFYNKYLKLWD